MTEHLTRAVARLEDQVAWWRTQALQIERDRTMLVYVLAAGLVIGLVACYFKALAGCGIFGTTLVIWVQGVYMTTVRRSEFRDHIREGQIELAQAEAKLRAASTESA